VEIFRHIDIATIAIQFIVLLFSLSIHEASHAWMADRHGDYTARYLGRVTLNPIPHIDPIGTIGWAKPVPVNHAHLRNPRRDNIFISLAGPGANLLAGFSAFFILLLLKTIHPGTDRLILEFLRGVPGNESILTPIVGILFYVLLINIALALFNCIPIPPLDGHWVLYGLLPDNAASALERVGSYGFLIIYALMFLGILDYIFIPIYMVIGLLI
jgi:Zn-dependent protease